VWRENLEAVVLGNLMEETDWIVSLRDFAADVSARALA
jgi:hypothetical protein